jgi:hypothetical protein
MPTSRHEWIANSHNPNPLERSLMRPLTIVKSTDKDLTHTPADGPDKTVTLECSEHDLLFPYLDCEKEHRIGKARLWLPPEIDATPAPRSVPLILYIHYETGEEWAASYLAKGWPVMTPIMGSDELMFNLIGPGMDHTLAMAQLVRRLGWVDLQRIGWIGGSAGGYQTLMTLTSLWPAAGAVAEVPLSDLWYNLKALIHDETYNEGAAEFESTVIPCCRAVKQIVDGTMAAIGEDVDKAWEHSVPVGACLIRSPVVMHTNTGDMACPSPQIGHAFAHIPEPGTVPPGWSHDYERFGNPHALGKPLIEWFERKDVETFCVGIPDDTPHVDPLPPAPGAEEYPPVTPFVAPMPYSRSHLVSIVVQDEGAPDARCMHSKYVVQMDSAPALEHHLSRGYTPADWLNPLLLTRLMGRFSEDVPQNPTLPKIRRQYPEYDKCEVLLALETYLGTPAREGNLALLRSTYAELPPVCWALDVEQDGTTASFSDDPVAGLLYHKAALLRKNGEPDAAEVHEAALAADHADSPFSKLSTEPEAVE